MRFWWANQGKTYDVSLAQGALWTCPSGKGIKVAARERIQELKPGDTVLHYADGTVRTVSYVITQCTPDVPRPPGHQALPGEPDTGWMVRLVPVTTGLSLPRARVAATVTGSSPLNVNGHAKEGFLYELDSTDGQALLDLLEVSVPAGGWPTELDDNEPAGPSDDHALVRTRREQALLRKYLLAGRTHAECALCGHDLPSELLVAAHIKPRKLCTDAERWNLRASGMLACLLGCDALFEHGYVIVDATGHVQLAPGVDAGDAAAALDVLDGKKCSAHGRHTSARFAAHRELHVNA